MDTKSRRKIWWGSRYLHGVKVYLHKWFNSCKGRIVTIQWRNQTIHWVIKITMTKEKMDMCASRCDILRRTWYHLYNNLVRNAYSECNHKEKLDKLKMMIILLKCIIKDKERLWKRLWKETKEMWQLKTISDLRLDLLLEKKYAIKDIIGSIDKIVIQRIN